MIQESITVQYQSEIGRIQVTGNEHYILKVEFQDNDSEDILDKPQKDSQKIYPHINDCVNQLQEYFEGERTTFNLPLDPRGTPFQKSVWDELPRIPFGKTVSYKDIAESIRNPRAVRAVGGVNGSNPISIIIPCHRVIAHDGSLGGYGSGIWRKRWLLEHEQKIIENTGR